jgi:hypothetical protein
MMRQDGKHFDENESYWDQLRDNFLGAIVAVILVVTGACLADELMEDSQSCYPPDGGCEARGVPVDQIGFIDVFQQ